jgi:glutathione synthase/RimK-type ligase-like ATP-grasp enzyme
MILLCGIPSETPLRMVREAAEAQGVEVVVLNQRQSAEMRIAWDFVPGFHVILSRSPERSEGSAKDLITGTLQIQGCSYPLQAFTGAYLRLMDSHALPEYNPQTAARIDALHAALIDWLELADLQVMNRLGAMGSNQSKPYQAQWIARAGFFTPPTLISNDPQTVRNFQAQHGRVVYKSISALRSVVQELERGRLRELEKIRGLPVQFQAYIPGEELRVHVAGQRVFATRITSPAVDYRYAGREGLDLAMEEVYIDEEIEDRCRALSRQLNLPLCGIDLKRTPEGRYYCFEVNPAPAFSFYQEHTGQDIAAAIVAYLIGGDDERTDG